MQRQYSYDEALKNCLDYFGNELSAKVTVDKYLLRTNDQVLVEGSPDDMHRRIARELARVESGKFKSPLTEDEIFSYLEGFGKIIPQGSPLYGIGNREQYITISNCYVVPSMLDSYGGIHRTDEHFSQICKRRGGVGVDVSALRPKMSATHNSSRVSTGLVPFCERLSNSIREVGQDGRRGASMLTISIHHPDILDFIRMKKDLTKVTGANVSVRYSDEFLQAVEKNVDYQQRWPVDSKTPQVSRMTSAREVWNEIIQCAWEMAEPGGLFWDAILRESPADCYKAFGFETISTNPCSELPLSLLDSCRLLLENLFAFVKNPFTKDAYFDFTEFYEVSQIAQRLMDDMIDLELECISRIIEKVKNDPEPEDIKRVEYELWQQVYKNCQNGRRTGTGLTGLGDTLAALGIRYGSDESIQLTEKIYRTLKLGCYRSSVDIAKELGPFPVWNYELEKDNPFLNRIKDDDPQLYRDMKKYGRRNIALLTSAPAGSVSILTRLRPRLHNISSGIEPAIWLEGTRRKKINHSDPHAKVDFVDQNGDKWQEFKVYHPALTYWKEVTGETDVTKSPWHGCCAADIDWKQRVKLQAAAQRHIDHSISSTINLPNDVSVEKVAEIYETAWKAGCKGITVYRDGCRTGVLVEEKKDVAKIVKTRAPKRPKSLHCDIHHLTSKGKKYYVIVGKMGDQPYEVMCTTQEQHDIPPRFTGGTLTKIRRGHYNLKLGSSECEVEDINICEGEEEALLRMTSTALRHGADIAFIVQQLEKTKGDLYSFGKVLARTLKKYIKDGTAVSGEKCPTCGGENLARQEGCISCVDCGWTKCS